ncbi:hypothetical protein AK812_SmicGene48070, partial [Symbiodinium microadriaticum]
MFNLLVGEEFLGIPCADRQIFGLHLPACRVDSRPVLLELSLGQ